MAEIKKNSSKIEGDLAELQLRFGVLILGEAARLMEANKETPATEDL